tara:strand:+ start:99 stop:356 length:258 start_codon:yes stop_codon:yes gene_type:complete
MKQEIKIGGITYAIDYSMGMEDLCSDCYEYDRKEFIGSVGNLQVYRLYAHDCYLVENYDSQGQSYHEGIAGKPSECDYVHVEVSE